MMTSDEKLDLLLKYAKSARRWAMARSVVSMLFFIIFVVLPIIGSVYLFRYFQNIDWSALQNVQGQFEAFKNFGAEFSQFKDAFITSPLP